MRSEQIIIAGQEYEVVELPMRRNAEWRHQLQDALMPMADLMQQSQTVSMDANSAGDVVGIIRKAGLMLIESPDTITDLVFSYAPELEKDRDRVLENAYDSEVMDAFTAVLRLAFPFGRLLSTVRALAASGASPTATQTTSPN